MKYFKDAQTGEVFAYESDGSQDYLINSNLTVMTESEIDAHLNPIIHVSIPSVVSMRQARLALLQSGLLDQVNQAVLAGGEADKITWEYAAEVNRTDPLVSNLALGLGLTEQHLDELFLLASTL